MKAKATVVRCVALLRGINVGKAKRVSMAELREVVESLGYRDVKTLLNSGNVVFTDPGPAKGDPAARMEEAIRKRLGVTSRVTVLTGAEVADVIARNPFGDIAKDPARFLVAVPRQPADRARLEALAREEWGPEALALGTRVVYLWCADGILESRAAAAVGKLLGDAVTSRNWTTMTKLHALVMS